MTAAAEDAPIFYRRLASSASSAALSLRSVSDPHDLATILAWHKAGAGALGFLQSEIEGRLIPHIPYDPATHAAVRTWDDVGRFQVRGGKRPTRFDNDGISSALAAGYAEQLKASGWKVLTPDGEVLTDVRPLVSEIVDLVIKATGAGTPSYNSWRSTVLRAYGVDPGRYTLESEPTPKTIVFTPTKELDADG